MKLPLTVGGSDKPTMENISKEAKETTREWIACPKCAVPTCKPGPTTVTDVWTITERQLIFTGLHWNVHCY
ncbi:hypothetical protein RRG08_061581 [Elysia crispata]|uniref:Uncharacterized protein n=1 Tax=Elysia crispata TaxID=231223 RepID=A0AAE0YU47_9GAST|nr:hypothetical protein RRG08_061581 [Elysia crispata]